MSPKEVLTFITNRKTLFLLIISFLSACTVLPAPAPLPVSVSPTASPAPTPTPSHFTENEILTLKSLKQIDDYPLYTMQYDGEYGSRRAFGLPAFEKADASPDWACALFTVLLDEEHLLFGRNFDWEFSPALLLFTDSPDGYASVSMVDVEYLGFERQSLFNLTELPLEEQEGLLDAPLIPFDGMNEYGLAIGMAAVPSSDVPVAPNKETIGSLGIIREILDHARNVDEATAIMESYNINFAGGPAVHYLIADANKKSVLVEFHGGEMTIIETDQPWHSATNFLLSSVEDPKDGNCWRYNKVNSQLTEIQGILDPISAMELLSEVSQGNTQWSVVYQMAYGEVSIAMGGDYAQVYTFQLVEER